jgi:phosphopantetheinyl transferase
MIRELVINDVQVWIWLSAGPAPVVDHPIRTQRLHPHRQAEFDMVAALMPHPWSWDDITKDPLGKPRLKNGNPKIGISHSNGFGCFAWSEEPFGIDLQTPHPSIFKVRNKYCHPNELAFLTNDIEDSRYLMLWSAKEAIYKFYGHGIDFSHDLIAQPFQESDDKISIVCQIDKVKCITFIVHCLQQENFIVTIAQTSKDENNV